MAKVKCCLTLAIAGMFMQTRRYTATTVSLLAGLLLGLVSVALLYGCSRENGASASSSVEQTPEAAIEVLVRSNGGQYAGPCEQTRSPEDIGKICSKLIEQRGTLQAHLIGRTFSEFSTWVFITPRDTGWAVLGTEELDFHDMSGSIPWPD
jgi:hypothetical protein